MQNLHIVYQPVIERFGLVAELLLHPLGQLAHGAPAIQFLPEEAAVLVQLDVADPGRVEELLCDGGVEAAVDHMDGDNALLVLAPVILGIYDGDEIQIVVVLFTGHIGFSSWINSPSRAAYTSIQPGLKKDNVLFLLAVLGGKEVNGEQNQGEAHQTADVADGEQLADVNLVAEVEGLALGVQTHGDDGQHSQQDAHDTLAGDKAGGVQNTGLNHVVLGLLRGVLALLQVPAQQAAQHHGHGQVDGQIEADGEGQYRDAQHLHHQGNEHAHEHQVPGQVAAHNTLDDHLHQDCLGSGQVLGAVAAPRVAQQVQDGADGHGGHRHANQLADLLLLGGGAHQEAGLQVLRGIAGDGSNDADDAADDDGGDHAVDAVVASGLQQQGGDEQGGDGHAGDGVIGGTNETHHPGGHGGKEEAEDDDNQGGEQVQGDDGQQPHHHGHHQDAQQNDLHGDVLLSAQGAVAPALAVVAHGILEGAHDEGQGLDEAEHAAAGHGAGADIAQEVAPQVGHAAGGSDQLVDGLVRGEQNQVAAEQGHQRHDDEPAQHAAGEQIGGHLHAADIAHTGQSGQHVNADAGTLVGGDVVGDLAGEQLQTIGNELVEGSDAQTGEHGGGLGAALFTGNEHLGTGLSLGVGQHAVLLDDQSAAQGDHHQNAQHTAAQGDETDLHQGGYVAKTILCPHEQGRQSEDGAGGHGLTGGTDGLDHVVLQNGVAAQDLADHSHGDDRGGDGGRHRHTHAQAKVRVCSAEDNGQNSAQDDGDHRELRHDLVCRNIRLEFFLFHDIRSLLSICCAEDAPYSLLRQEHNTQPHHFIKISSVRQGISLFIVGFDE